MLHQMKGRHMAGSRAVTGARPLRPQLRVAAGADLMLAALMCGGTFVYANRISTRDGRRSQVFLAGMGTSLIALTAGLRLLSDRAKD